jgi:Zn-finger nucleic acid-binding protein
MANLGLGKEKPIDCPRCGVGLAQAKIDVFGPDVRIDVCPECRGTWYDRAELARVLKDRGLHARIVDFPKGGSESQLFCPRCGNQMRLRTDRDVEVDACPTCKGVWLDLGERRSLKAHLDRDRLEEEAQMMRVTAVSAIMNVRQF